MRPTRDQKRFTISDVAADWHVANDTLAHYAAIRCLNYSEQLDPWCSQQT